MTARIMTINEGPTTLLDGKVEWNGGRSRCELGRKSLGLTDPNDGSLRITNDWRFRNKANLTGI
jgi:hypothetical protein